MNVQKVEEQEEEERADDLNENKEAVLQLVKLAWGMSAAKCKPEPKCYLFNLSPNEWESVKALFVFDPDDVAVAGHEEGQALGGHPGLRHVENDKTRTSEKVFSWQK